MKKLFVTLVVILVVSVLVVGCGEMVDTAVSDSSEQVQRHKSSSSQEKVQGSMETEYKTTISPSLGVSFDEFTSGLMVTQENIKTSRRVSVNPPSIGEIILAPPEFDYKAALSPSLGVSFEEFMFGLIYSDNNAVESRKKTVDPPSIGEIILAPPEFDYKTALSPSLGVSFEEFMFGLIYADNSTVESQKITVDSQQ